VNGLHLSIDFRGGTLLDMTFEKTATVEEIKSALTEISDTSSVAIASSSETSGEEAAKDFTKATIIPSGDNRWIIRTEHMDNDTHDDLLIALEKRFGTVTEDRFTTIGPTIGTTLKNRAVLSLSIAFIAIILYIAFAFRRVPKGVSSWRFGICAVAALTHDVIIPIGIFSLFKFEVDALFVTALLTVVGFSVHDTIVVFDRLRENLKNKREGESLTHQANASMTQTMARSINTSLSTLITLLALLFFGSQSIFYFILTLVIGIVVGTYSSIFTATPLLIWWQERSAARQAKE
ncbi:MAG: protein translocase subunit SecF, partial [Patescibacteria group bacterium]